MIEVDPIVLLNTVFESMDYESAKTFIEKLNLNFDEIFEDILEKYDKKEINKDVIKYVADYSILSLDINDLCDEDIINFITTIPLSQNTKDSINNKISKCDKSSYIKDILCSKLVEWPNWNSFIETNWGRGIEGIGFDLFDNVPTSEILNEDTIKALLYKYAEDNHFYHFAGDTKPYTILFEIPEIGYEWHLDDFMDYKPYCTTLDSAKYEVNEHKLDWTDEMEEWFDENGDIIHESCSVYDAARKFYCTFCIKKI